MVLLKSLLLIVVVISAYYDVRWRRIPNWLIVFGLGAAVILQPASGGIPALLDGIKGFSLGLALLFIPFLLRGMGAGDVKLLGVIGAMQGWVFVVNTFLWMAVWGGLMAIIALLASGKIQLLVLRLAAGYYPILKIKLAVMQSRVSSEKTTIPYGVAIGLGAICSLIWVWW